MPPYSPSHFPKTTNTTLISTKSAAVSIQPHARMVTFTEANSAVNHLTYGGNTSSTSNSPSSTPDSSNSTSPTHSPEFEPQNHLIASLFREEGHIYSLAAAGDMLYTGSESNSVRVWKNLKDFSGFKSKSGMVKAIVVVNDKIFTGHHDGKIRVWAVDDKPTPFNQVGHLPKTKHLLLKSLNPSVRRNRNVPWIKHCDTVSCMAVDENRGLLYSGSWDKTLKIWRISDSKCLESVAAHDDAVNSVVALPARGGMVVTGSADGTVKAWRRDFVGRRTEHVLVGVLLRQEHAVTALAAAEGGGAVYAGTSDGLVTFWEVGRRLVPCGGVLRGHKMAVLCLAAAGRLVMSGSADKSICVWRRGGGGVHECVAVLTGHDGPVKCLATEEDEEEEGRRRWIVYSGSLDKSVKIWRVSE